MHTIRVRVCAGVKVSLCIVFDVNKIPIDLAFVAILAVCVGVKHC